jgi:hypothetical protein
MSARISGEMTTRSVARSVFEESDAMARATLVEVSIEAGRGLQMETSRSSKSREGGIGIMEQNNQSHHLGLTALFSPTALRIELLGVVAFVLLLGRLSPDFGKLLLQFSQLLFR